VSKHKPSKPLIVNIKKLTPFQELKYNFMSIATGNVEKQIEYRLIEHKLDYTNIDQSTLEIEYEIEE